MEPVTIIVDLRERRPYRFHGAITKALSTGDYSILGLENCIALERKSLPDLLSVIGFSIKELKLTGRTLLRKE